LPGPTHPGALTECLQLVGGGDTGPPNSALLRSDIR